MKGVVFRAFVDLVEERYGEEVVDRLLSHPGLSTGGAYTAVGTYDHTECSSGSRLTIFSDGTFEIKRADGKWGNMEEFLERLRSMKPDEPLKTLVKEAREAAGRADLDDDFSLIQVRFGR